MHFTTESRSAQRFTKSFMPLCNLCGLSGSVVNLNMRKNKDL